MKWLIISVVFLMAGISASIAGLQMHMLSWMSIKAEVEIAAIPEIRIPVSYSQQEKQLLQLGLVDIERYDARLLVRAAYATADNQLGTVLYPEMKRLFTRPEVAARLAKAQDILSGIDSSLRLVILDAARPLSLQEKMWRLAVEKGIQENFTHPSKASLHNYGVVVDVTIMGADSLLDMGSGYEVPGPESGPRYEDELFSQGRLQQIHIDNRLLLRNVMRDAGFRSIQTEWWHFNGLNLENARPKFPVIP